MTDLAQDLALPAQNGTATAPGLSTNDAGPTDVCAQDSVGPDRGVAVLVGGEPVALFRLAPVNGLPEEWFAVDHIDPKTGAPVMARGLVGSAMVDGTPVSTIASPLYKQRYDLRTGRGIDGEVTALRTWDVEVIDGRITISGPRPAHH